MSRDGPMMLERNPGPDFSRLELGRRLVYIRRELAPVAPALLSAIDAILRSGAAGAGNRSSGFPLNLEGAPPLFVRRSRRGGLMHLLGDLYIGFAPRVLSELAITSEVRKRGVPVPEPVGAIVDRLAPGMHRAMLITRALSGMTLWEFVQAEDDPRVRSQVLRLARHTIDTMHEKGLFHADLNLHNLFVITSAENFSVAILDLDKARLYRRAITGILRRRNLRRLARSVRKLDPAGRYFDPAALSILTSP